MRLSIIVCFILTASSYVFAPPKKNSSKTVSSRSKQDKKDKDDELLDGILNSAEHQEAVKEASCLQVNNKSKEAFFKAIVNGDIASCQLLLDAGVSIDVVDKEKNSALIYAIFSKSSLDKKLAKCSLDQKADLSEEIIDFIKMIDFLLAHGANPNLSNKNKITPLIAAAEKNQEAILQKLLAAGAHVDTQNFQGLTALSYAAFNNNLDCLKALLKAGAKDLQSKEGCTALMVAIENKHSQAARMLINEANFDLNKKDQKGDTALHVVASMGAEDVFEDLIKAGVDLQVKNEYGNTALVEALLIAPFLKESTIAEKLLIYGADPRIKNIENINSVFIARKFLKKQFFEKQSFEELAQSQGTCPCCKQKHNKIDTAKLVALAQLTRECASKQLEQENKLVFLRRSYQQFADNSHAKREIKPDKFAAPVPEISDWAESWHKILDNAHRLYQNKK